MAKEKDSSDIVMLVSVILIFLGLGGVGKVIIDSFFKQDPQE